MKIFKVNWNHLNNLDDFYNEIEKIFLYNSNLKFWRNLDALEDVFYWWYWSFKTWEKIEIIWENFDKSKKVIEKIDIIEEIILDNNHIIFTKK